MAGITITADSATQFETGAAEFNSTCRLDDTNFAVAYRDNNDGNKGKVNVGSRTGTTVTISEANAVVFNNDATDMVTVRALSSTKIVISYRDVNTVIAYVVCATISGTTITVGTPVALDAVSQIYAIGLTVLDSTNFVVTRFYAYGFSYVCSVSGTTISKGSYQQGGGGAGNGGGASSVGLDSTHFACVQSASSLRAYAGTVDTGAQTITFGSEVVLINTNETWTPQVAAFDSQHIVVASGTSASGLKVIAASINLTSLVITQGSAITYSVQPSGVSVCAITASNCIVSLYHSNITKGEIRAATLTGGTTLAFDAQGAVVFDNSTSAYTAICRLTDTYFILGYKRG